MIRGTTAQFKFKLPYKFDELDTATITFWQSSVSGAKVLVKRVKDQCSKADNDEYSLCVSLQPEDTLLFTDKLKAKVQLRAVHAGTAFASKEELITVYPINDEVIDTELPKPSEEGYVILDGEEIDG